MQTTTQELVGRRVVVDGVFGGPTCEGTAVYVTADGWVGIRDADGATVHEWQAWRVTAAE